MIRRARTGKPIFRADKMHVHHQLLSLGLKHATVVKTLCSINLTLALIVYFAKDKSIEGSFIITIGTTILIVYLIAHLLSLQKIAKSSALKGYEEGVKNTLSIYMQSKNYQIISRDYEQYDKDKKIESLDEIAFKIFSETKQETVTELAKQIMLDQNQKATDPDSKLK